MGARDSLEFWRNAACLRVYSSLLLIISLSTGAVENRCELDVLRRHERLLADANADLIAIGCIMDVDWRQQLA